MSQPTPPTTTQNRMEGEQPSSAALGPTLVIIPTYNESENIARIISRTRKAVPDAHILIADDNSPDGTGKLADEIAALMTMCMSCTGSARKALARRTWLVLNGASTPATKCWSKWMPMGHTSQSNSRELLAALADADLVLGSRWVEGGEVVNWPKSREALSRGGNVWTRIMLGIPLRDATGGFRAFRRNTLLRLGLDNVASAGYCFQVDLAWRALKGGFRVVEVPITFIEREYGASKMSKRIVIEALVLTTVWGVGHRAKQLRALVTETEGADFMRLRHGWPLALLAALLVAIPILEVWLLVQVGQNLGLLPTVLILLVVAIVGFLLMRHEGSRAWKALNDAFTKGKVPTGELADAALILVGGVLLMLPGFLTDVIGLLFLLRWTRPFARKVIAFFVARRINRLGIPVMRARLDRENLIEGETVESPPANGQKREGPTIIAGEIEEPSQPARPEDSRP